MVAAGAVQSSGPALLAAGVALLAVLAGVAFRGAAAVGVLATAGALALSAPSPVLAALAGMSALVYLMLRYASTGDAAAVLTVPTMLGALGFSAIAVVGATVPLSLPWVPLIAPLAVVALYVVGVDRYVGDGR
ncbi:hypothetical protein H7I40_24145 [Mycolicibacterium madagascariense]|nr:hypothetical protein [Mycolicibacterium madagascariense]